MTLAAGLHRFLSLCLDGTLFLHVPHVTLNPSSLSLRASCLLKKNMLWSSWEMKWVALFTCLHSTPRNFTYSAHTACILDNYVFAYIQAPWRQTGILFILPFLGISQLCRLHNKCCRIIKSSPIISWLIQFYNSSISIAGRVSVGVGCRGYVFTFG